VWATSDKNSVPDIIVFPETAYPYTVVDNDFPLSHILNSKVVIGANHYKDGKLYNSLLLANEKGQIEHLYSKSHLVPFGEYRPFGDIIPTPGLLTPGDGPELITIKTKKQDFVFVPAVCYEIVFSDSLVPRGKNPDAIINITNDTWFGKTPGTYQHLDMVRRYAIESGLPIIRANYSGISAFVLSNGEILSALPIGQTGVLDGTVWGAHKTIYRSIGRNRIMILILLVSVLGVMLGRKKKS
jgi:apolipoprotein N-acyltransferase